MMSPQIKMVKEVGHNIMSAILETGIVRRFEYLFYFFDEVFWKELVLVLLALIGLPILAFLALICILVTYGYAIHKFREWKARAAAENDDDWVKTVLYFHNFANMTKKGQEVSDTFSCLGHTWRMVVSRKTPKLKNCKRFPAEVKPRMIGMYLLNKTVKKYPNKSIKIEFQFSVKGFGFGAYPDPSGFVQTLTNKAPNCGISNIGNHFFMKHFCLVNGALRVEVKMKLPEPKWGPKALPLPPISPSEECPICMEHISHPWGVATPCGHPFHQSCWDEVVARHWNESDDEAQPSCVICRKVSTGFQRVFFGCSEAGASDGSNGRLEAEANDNNSSFVNRLLRRRTWRPSEP